MEKPSLQGRVPNDQVVWPRIDRWSDIAWVEWMNQCGQNLDCIRGIRHFAAHHCQNDETRALARQLYGVNLKGDRNTATIPRWSSRRSRQVSWVERAGRELMSCPNVRGFSWMRELQNAHSPGHHMIRLTDANGTSAVIQHNQYLGNKLITGINVYLDANCRRRILAATLRTL